MSDEERRLEREQGSPLPQSSPQQPPTSDSERISRVAMMSLSLRACSFCRSMSSGSEMSTISTSLSTSSALGLTAEGGVGCAGQGRRPRSARAPPSGPPRTRHDLVLPLGDDERGVGGLGLECRRHHGVVQLLPRVRVHVQHPRVEEGDLGARLPDAVDVRAPHDEDIPPGHERGRVAVPRAGRLAAHDLDAVPGLAVYLQHVHVVEAGGAVEAPEQQQAASVLLRASREAGGGQTGQGGMAARAAPATYHDADAGAHARRWLRAGLCLDLRPLVGVAAEDPHVVEEGLGVLATEDEHLRSGEP